ncbi:MAG: magnesium and cobalt exporter, family [Candidatus Binatota bacterium]|jgi:CBS domain containing-hemolysin-like protein|nr:magnesium and cobalt exporter, family [Candidatus Binatota bacterium]
MDVALAVALLAALAVKALAAASQVRRVGSGDGHGALLGTMLVGWGATVLLAGGVTWGLSEHLLIAGPSIIALAWGVGIVVGEIFPATAAASVAPPPVPRPEPTTALGQLAPGAGLRALLESWTVRPADEPILERERVIRRIFRFRELTAGDLAVPLVRVAAISDDLAVGDAIHRIRRDRFSRIPVFHVRMFDIIGVLHALDLVGPREAGAPLLPYVRPVFYAPESKRADALLATLRYEGIKMAVVVDEYGGAIGIVTVEDLLEAIVGELGGEHDAASELSSVVEEGRTRLDARYKVAHANERFGWNLPEGDYETLAGLMLAHLGRIPRSGEEIEVAGFILRVTVADTRAIREIEVRVADALGPGSAVS